MSEAPTPQEIRDAMPLALLLGVELLEARPALVRGRLEWARERCTVGGLLESELTREDGALVAKVTQTQAFHYPHP